MVNRESMTRWMEDHFVGIAVSLGLVFLLGLAYVGYSHWLGRQEAHATEALYEVESQLSKLKERVDDPQNMDFLANLKDEKNKKKPVDFDSEVQPLLKTAETRLKAHANTKAAVVTALKLSDLLFTLGRQSEAQTVLTWVTYRPKKGSLLFALQKLHMGHLLASAGNFQGAMDQIQSVVDTPSMRTFHAEAILRLGILSEQLNHVDRARDYYTKVSSEFGESEAARIAKNYLRALELKTEIKQP